LNIKKKVKVKKKFSNTSSNVRQGLPKHNNSVQLTLDLGIIKTPSPELTEAKRRYQSAPKKSKRVSRWELKSGATKVV